MALNYIWIGFFVIAFVIALIRLIFFGDTEIFHQLTDAMFNSSKSSVMDIALPLIGSMAMWLGILNVGEKAGAIRFLSRIVGSFLNKLFPEIPKDHPANGQIVMNFSANMLGLSNAATPLGLKAMDSMQSLNPDKDTASNAQIMFLVLNTAGFMLIPVTILAQRAVMHSHDTTAIFIPCIIASFVATVVGIVAVAIKQRINLFDKVILSWLGSITAVIALMVWYMHTYLTREQIQTVSNVGSNVIIFSIVVLFLVVAMRKGVNVFESFIDGAKQGFEVSVKIIPYLVALLVGIAVFRACGALDYLVGAFKWACHIIGIDDRFCDALPVAFLKPLSGSGARTMMISNMQHFGVDSFVGKMSAVLNGCADTTFYIIALYFGSVGIKNSRYAVPFGLIADLAGIIAAIWVSYLFWG